MRLSPVLVALIACNPPVTADDQMGDSGDNDSGSAAAFEMTLPWDDGAAIPEQYTCGAGQVNWTSQHNPLVSWANPPAGTAAFAMIYVDSDLNDWEHWAFYTADATVLSIAENTSNTASMPGGVTELRSQDGRTGYVPNCPGSSHTYTWTLHAVSDAAALAGQTTFDGLRAAAEGASLGSLTYTGVVGPL